MRRKSNRPELLEPQMGPRVAWEAVINDQ